MTTNIRETIKKALEENNIKKIRYIFKVAKDVKTNIDLEYPRRISPLMLARTKEMAQILVDEFGAKIDDYDIDHMNTLVYAQNDEVADFLLERGVDFHPFMHGAKDTINPLTRVKSPKVCKKLIEKGYDVNKVNIYHESPLSNAVRDDNIELAKLLLEHGALITPKEADDFSNAMRHIKSVEMLKLLIENCGDVDHRNNRQETPLMRAVKDIELVKFLIKHGADVNAQSETGWSALMWAVNNDKIDSARELLEHGAFVNAKNTHGQSAAHMVKSKEMIQLLKEYNANFDVRDNSGMTPAMFLTRTDNATCLNELIENGTNILIKDKNQRDTLMLAVYNRAEKCVDLLLQHNIDVNQKDYLGRNALGYAKDYGAEIEERNILKSLIRANIDITTRDTQGKAMIEYLPYGLRKQVLDIKKGIEFEKDMQTLSPFPPSLR